MLRLTVFLAFVGALAAAQVPAAPYGSVEVSVRDENGSPIPGVTLRLQDGNPVRSRTVQTDGLGRFLFEEVISPASVSARVMPEQAAAISKGYEPADTGRFNVQPAEKRQLNIRLTSVPFFHIRGCVTQQSEVEASFAAVTDCGLSEQALLRRVSITKEGTFDASGFLPGQYCVILQTGASYTQKSHPVFATVTDRDPGSSRTEGVGAVHPVDCIFLINRGWARD
jgi:hypothetical protein